MQLSLTLAATDLDNTYDFYRQLPGLTVRRLTDSRGTVTTLLVCSDNLHMVFQPLHNLEQQHPALFQHLGRTLLGAGLVLELVCSELDVVYRTARYHKWPILYELDDREHQRRELWLQDPNGYLLALNEEPAAAP
ncbi:MAG TPA: VOC family protein [Pelovirga sp.]|nr:VOC family protein [Pelovirga sp.]